MTGEGLVCHETWVLVGLVSLSNHIDHFGMIDLVKD